MSTSRLTARLAAPLGITAILLTVGCAGSRAGATRPLLKKPWRQVTSCYPSPTIRPSASSSGSRPALRTTRPGKEGLASLTGAMISGGATTASSYEEILEKLYPLAASYRVRVDKEMTTLRGRTHRDNLPAFFSLLQDAYLATSLQ